MKPRWNTSLILGTLLIAALAYIGSLYANRYRLVEDGKKRIDTITGRVWELKNEVVWDEGKAKIMLPEFREEVLAVHFPNEKLTDEEGLIMLEQYHQEKYGLPEDVQEFQTPNNKFFMWRKAQFWKPVGK